MKTWNLPSVVEMDINMTMSNTVDGVTEESFIAKHENNYLNNGQQKKLANYYNSTTLPSTGSTGS